MATDRDLAALPKCELHIHLEGAMRTETLVELCGKHGITVPPDPRGKQYDSFDAFVTCYIAACECLREREDVFRIVRECAEDAVAAGCRWVEVAPSFDLWAARFGGREPTLKLLLEAAEAAEDAVGGKAAIAYVVAAERHEPVADAVALAKCVAGVVTKGEHKIKGRDGIVGFGLHASEFGNPPAPFAEAFDVCREAGIRSLPHAGEFAPGGGVSGSESVVSCIDDLGASRILHGVRANDDPALVKRLIELGDKISLDMCPSSNVLLGVVPSIEEHPLPAMLRAGVHVTVNSDDPLLFGPRLLDEFKVCRKSLGLSDEELAKVAGYSFTHSSAPDAVKQQGLVDIASWLSSPP